MQSSNVPLLSKEQVLEIYVKNLPCNSVDWYAFYSSILGGIVTDPSLFLVPIDDHLVHRGHAVFDTCNVKNGLAYGLDFHLDRFLRSASQARIQHSYTKEILRDIIIRTIAASEKRNKIFVRYWMGAGRGDFSVSTSNCTGSATLYVCVHKDVRISIDEEKGRSEYISHVPLKPPLLATMKSNNYLLNALCAMDSEKFGGALGIQVDSNGQLMESSIANVSIVDKNRVLRTAPFECVLAGTTVQRAFVLAKSNLCGNLLEACKYDHIHESELYESREVIIFGGGFCVPIIKINDKTIGSGLPGPVWKEIGMLLELDMENPDFTDPIPYGTFDHCNARNS